MEQIFCSISRLTENTWPGSVAVWVSFSWVFLLWVMECRWLLLLLLLCSCWASQSADQPPVTDTAVVNKRYLEQVLTYRLSTTNTTGLKITTISNVLAKRHCDIETSVRSEIFGLSFERPYLKQGQKLMYAKIRGFQQKIHGFWGKPRISAKNPLIFKICWFRNSLIFKIRSFRNPLIFGQNERPLA